jgi:hypothetical protein
MELRLELFSSAKNGAKQWKLHGEILLHADVNLRIGFKLNADFKTGPITVFNGGVNQFKSASVVRADLGNTARARKRAESKAR